MIEQTLIKGIKISEGKHNVIIFKSGYEGLYVYYYEGIGNDYPHLSEYEQSMYHLYSKKTILSTYPEIEKELDLL